jgi:RNA polymerase sigma factor (sigma-70 family)
LKDDLKIWEDFKNGDKAALSLIYFEYFHSMYQYGIKFNGDSEFVKDCIQEVFFNMIRSGSRLGSTDNIRFYLFRALKNEIRKETERQRKVGLAANEIPEFQLSFLIEEQSLETEKDVEKGKALFYALSTLSPRQREIIYLKYECGMNYRQICEIMDLKSDSARKLVFRAVQSLKTAIEDHKNTFLFLFSLLQKYVL